MQSTNNRKLQDQPKEIAKLHRSMALALMNPVELAQWKPGLISVQPTINSFTS
jgi:hypothetical protein